MLQYRDRIMDPILRRKLEGKGAVLIEGPKGCGKTTTAEQIARSSLYMDDPEKREQNLAMSDLNPGRLLKGDVPRLIDEWQLAPKLWDAVRIEVDHRRGTGQFILTGSAVPPDPAEISHSGTGRFARIMMRPMSLFESGESSGDVSLKALFDGEKDICGTSNITLDQLAFLVCRGGWPRAVDMRDESALEQAADFCDAIVHSELNQADHVRKNPKRVERLMVAYAKNQGSQISNAEIARDMSAEGGISANAETVSSYLQALRKIFVTEDMPAWKSVLRLKTAIRTSDSRYFVDPSIAAAALHMGPADLIAHLVTFVPLFETLCVRDLRVFADALDGTVFHFLNKNGLECDAVVQLRNGQYGLIETELGGASMIEEGAKTLKTLEKHIDPKKMQEPSFLMVLTGIGDYAYRRRDGIFVVPIGSLKG